MPLSTTRRHPGHLAGPATAGGSALPVDDTRIREIMELAPPSHLLREFPTSERAAATTFHARQAIHRVLHGADDRLLVVVGPCSIHDYDAAIDYATRLALKKRELDAELIVVMRVYFEKPRTTVGWKGLINDPRLDDSFRINEGLRLARRILLEINELDLPAGTEYLDMITPQYLADLIAWGAIGARTTESQVHRELASGLSMPVGFKNGTDGGVQIAIDAVRAAAARTASTAIEPSVPFLNPTGHDRPEASWRWDCDSVVRAPIAPHAMRSAMYCGEMRSRNSVPAGTPISLISRSSLRARRSPSFMSNVSSRCGSLMRPFQPTVVRGFSK